MPAARRRFLSALLVGTTAAGAGLLFATSAITADGTDLRAGRRMKLTELIIRERSDLSASEQRAAVLRAAVARATAASAARDSRVATESARGDALALAAGLLPVVGDGVTVSLDDAPAGTQDGQPDDLVVHQQDVQAVVNGLWAGGAEAMTLMGQRVISTSAVRCVGNTVVLHGQVYGPPFVVTAVGPAQKMRDALDQEPGVELFRRYVDRFGLGYRVESATEVTLPAYAGPVELPVTVPPP